MENKVLTAEEKAILKKMGYLSHMTFINFNMVKMEANCFTMTMAPAIESIYGDDMEEKKAAYSRHQNFFNTHAVPLAFIAGLAYAMEKERKETGAIDTATIESIKAALMGPTAGMFDSLFFNCLRVIGAGIGMGLCAQGNFLGSLIFILFYGVPQSVCKFLFVKWGYTYGTSFIDMVFASGLMQALTKAASVLGLTVIGALIPSNIGVTCPISFTTATGAEIVIQNYLDMILPKMIPVLLTFAAARLLGKKKVKITTLVLVVLVFSLVASAAGILA